MKCRWRVHAGHWLNVVSMRRGENGFCLSLQKRKERVDLRQTAAICRCDQVVGCRNRDRLAEGADEAASGSSFVTSECRTRPIPLPDRMVSISVVTLVSRRPLPESRADNHRPRSQRGQSNSVSAWAS